MRVNIFHLCLFCFLVLSLPLPAEVIAQVDYFYADDGTLVGKAFNGKRVNFEYDLRGQLLAVTDDDGNDLERYTYDPAGNRLSKTVDGVTTTYTYDEANQLVTSTVNGITTAYQYDAAGRWHQRSRRIFSSFYFTSQCNSRYSSDVYEPSVKFQVQLHFNT